MNEPTIAIGRNGRRALGHLARAYWRLESRCGRTPRGDHTESNLPTCPPESTKPGKQFWVSDRDSHRPNVHPAWSAFRRPSSSPSDLVVQLERHIDMHRAATPIVATAESRSDPKSTTRPSGVCVPPRSSAWRSRQPPAQVHSQPSPHVTPSDAPALAAPGPRASFPPRTAPLMPAPRSRR
jgi:hypothetical protein